jgi:hypothetical protein
VRAGSAQFHCADRRILRLAKEARLGHHAMRAECARYPRDPSTSLGTTAGEKNQREGAGVTAFGQAMIESLPIII